MKLSIFHKQFPEQQGFFFLSAAVVAGVVIAAGAVTIVLTSYNREQSSVAKKNEAEAELAADSGLTAILNRLNDDYSYLLATDCEITTSSGPAYCTGWSVDTNTGGTFTPKGQCIDTGETPTIPDDIFNFAVGTSQNKKTAYRLVSYNFQGDIQQGGEASITVRGYRLNNADDTSSPLSTVDITKVLTINPKNCFVPSGEISNESGCPGILACCIDVGNNDVLGSVSANVLCVGDCTEGTNLPEHDSEFSIQKQGIVEGKTICSSTYPFPPIPPFPSDIQYFKDSNNIDIAINNYTANINSTRTIQANSDNGGLCGYKEDSNGNISTYCKINDISLSGGGNNADKLTLDTTSGPIKLYIHGDISVSGNGEIQHKKLINGSLTGWTTATQGFFKTSDLAFYSKESVLSGCNNCGNCNDPTLQDWVFAGGSNALAAFIHAPNATVGINGGSGNPDFVGSIWSFCYGASNSNNAEVFVPDDVCQDLNTNIDSNIGYTIKEYRALGTKKVRRTVVPSIVNP